MSVVVHRLERAIGIEHLVQPEGAGLILERGRAIQGIRGHTLDRCRANLKDSLQLMVETHRDEARMGLDPSCILEPIEIEVGDEEAVGLRAAAAAHYA